MSRRSSIQLNRTKFDAQKSKLQNLLERKLKDRKFSDAEKFRRVAQLTAQNLAEATFPSRNAIGLAASAIRFDVNRVYIVATRAYEILRDSVGERAAGAFYSAYKRGDFARAQHILRTSGSSICNIAVGSPLNPALHEASRNKAGRVIIERPLQIVSASELQAFTKITIARLGKTASGWSACAEKLGGNGNSIPWKGTAVHGSDGGRVQIRHNHNKVTYILTNLRPLAHKLLSAGQYSRILKDSREWLKEWLAHRSR